jgi:hypothetical protein
MGKKKTRKTPKWENRYLILSYLKSGKNITHKTFLVLTKKKDAKRHFKKDPWLRNEIQRQLLKIMKSRVAA